jgi:hypothetical protein
MLVRDKDSKKLINITKSEFHNNTNYYKEIIYVKFKKTIDEQHKKQLLSFLE